MRSDTGRTDPWLGAKDFLNKHRAASAATEAALSVSAVMQSLDASEHGYMACFAIAAVLQAFELDRIGASGLSMDEAPQRTKAGLAAVKARGTKLGSGYDGQQSRPLSLRLPCLLLLRYNSQKNINIIYVSGG
jgi:hypothetical protein